MTTRKGQRGGLVPAGPTVANMNDTEEEISTLPQKTLSPPSNTVNMNETMYLEFPSYDVYTTEILIPTSIEYVYNDIRFKLFPNIPTDQLKDLFMDMIVTPLKHPKLIDTFVSLINGGNFTELAEFTKVNKFKNINEHLKKIFATYDVEQKFIPNFSKIFDIYLNIEDPNTALGVLRYIIFFPYESQEVHESILTDIETYSQFQLEDLATSYVMGAIII